MDDLELKLTQDNWISLQQFNLAQQEATKLRKSIWVSLVKLGYLSQEDVAVFFAQESGIPFVRVSDYEINAQILSLVDENFCRENLVVPLFKVKDRLFVAFSNPLDAELVDRLAKLTGCDIEPLISTVESISRALDLYYGLEDKNFIVEKFIFKQAPLRRLGFWRESQRLPLEIPVSIEVEDKDVILHYSSAIDGSTRDISNNGTAVGLHIFLFIPRGTTLSLEFKPGKGIDIESPQIIKAKGEVVYCRMEKGQRYFMGIKFTEIKEEARRQLLNLSGHS